MNTCIVSSATYIYLYLHISWIAVKNINKVSQFIKDLSCQSISDLIKTGAVIIKLPSVCIEWPVWFTTVPLKPLSDPRGMR